ncbi:MAG: peptidase MA family metallohydrolase [Anaerolineae bacterium]
MTKIKWHTIANLVLALSLLLAPASAAADAIIADDSITVIENTASYIFAQQITFTLEGTSTAQVSEVYLFFATTGGGQTETQNVPFEQEGNTVRASYMHDLRLSSLNPSPLNPFDTVTFRWEIEFADGKSYPIDEQQLEYIDNRFAWDQSSDEENHITVHWIEEEGDPKFGQTALDIARVSLQEINAELRAPLPEAITIYIYDTQDNLNAAMILAGRDWVGGQAHPDLGVIVVAIPANDFATSRMERFIPHEITHLLVYQSVTPEGYRYVPEWLDEGLSTANERLPTPEYTLMIEEYRQRGQLIPLRDLCVPFSPDTQAAYLSYAQSGSIVKYIRERYGAQGIRDLLTAYKNGASCTSGVEEALNISIDTLEANWQASLAPQSQSQSQPQPQPSSWPAWVQQVGPWAGMWLLGLLLALPMIGRTRRRR